MSKFKKDGGWAELQTGYTGSKPTALDVPGVVYRDHQETDTGGSVDALLTDRYSRRNGI
jgi:hypothetical protein